MAKLASLRGSLVTPGLNDPLSVHDDPALLAEARERAGSVLTRDAMNDGARQRAETNWENLRSSISAQDSNKGKFEHVIEQAQRKKFNVETSIDEHWNAVMTKLAPKGYHRMPAWQKSILDRVVKSMSMRSFNQLPPSASATSLKNESSAEEELSSYSKRSKVSGISTPDEYGSRKKREFMTKEQLEKAALTEKQNQVHFYTSCIQTSQLVQQDLDEANRHMQEQIKDILKDNQHAKMNWQQEKGKMKRKGITIMNQCQTTEEKGNELIAYIKRLMAVIDDLRKTRSTYIIAMKQLKHKELKMNEDMQFVAQSTQLALDQRIKFKTKLGAMKRDSAHEKENKFGDIQKLGDKIRELDGKYEQLQGSLDNQNEQEKILMFSNSKNRRTNQMKQDARLGYLQNQVKGWDQEFTKMQLHAGMDKKFTPGDSQIIEELLSKFEVHELKTASLLEYLDGQGNLERNLQRELQEIQEKERVLQEAHDKQMAQQNDISRKDYVKLDNEIEQKLKLQDGAFQRLTEVVHKSATRISKSDLTPDVTNDQPPVVQDLVVLENKVNEMMKRAKTLVDSEEVSDDRRDVYMQWTKPRKTKTAMSVNDIHRQLASQAAAQAQYKTQDDDDDEFEEKHKEEESRAGPFSRHHVNQAIRDQEVQKWLKKRNATLAGAPADEFPAASRSFEASANRSAPQLRDSPGKTGSPPPADKKQLVSLGKAPFSGSLEQDLRAVPALAANHHAKSQKKGMMKSHSMATVSRPSHHDWREPGGSKQRINKAGQPMSPTDKGWQGESGTSSRQNLNALMYILGTATPDSMEAKEVLSHARKRG